MIMALANFDFNICIITENLSLFFVWRHTFHFIGRTLSVRCSSEGARHELHIWKYVLLQDDLVLQPQRRLMVCSNIMKTLPVITQNYLS